MGLFEALQAAPRSNSGTAAPAPLTRINRAEPFCGGTHVKLLCRNRQEPPAAATLRIPARICGRISAESLPRHGSEPLRRRSGPRAKGAVPGAPDDRTEAVRPGSRASVSATLPSPPDTVLCSAGLNGQGRSQRLNFASGVHNRAHPGPGSRRADCLGVLVPSVARRAATRCCQRE